MNDRLTNVFLIIAFILLMITPEAKCGLVSDLIGKVQENIERKTAMDKYAADEKIYFEHRNKIINELIELSGFPEFEYNNDFDVVKQNMQSTIKKQKQCIRALRAIKPPSLLKSYHSRSIKFAETISVFSVYLTDLISETLDKLQIAKSNNEDFPDALIENATIKFNKANNKYSAMLDTFAIQLNADLDDYNNNKHKLPPRYRKEH